MTDSPARTSIALSIGLMLTLVALVVFSAVGALLHWSLARDLLFSEQLQLERKAEDVQQRLLRLGARGEMGRLGNDIDQLIGNDPDLQIWIVAADGRVLHGLPQVPEIRGTGPAAPLGGDAEGRIGLRRPVQGEGLDGLSLIVTLQPRARRAMMRTFDQATLLVCSLGLLATVVLGVLVTRRGLQPLHRLSAQATALSTHSLSSRLTRPADGVELLPLVKAFNHALDRVEASYRQLEGFNADVAHELRTPLAVLITGCEVVLAQPRTSQEWEETVAVQLEELRMLTAMVDDMLFLARADRGDGAADLDEVSLRDQTLAVADYLEGTLLDGQHRLNIEGDARAHANANLLRRALFNLLTNAIRYTPTGEAILIRIEAVDGEGARVTVCNPGPAIAEEDRERLFDRFWRKDPARARDAVEHHGLGLAIVRAIARMHGGSTFARSESGVTLVGFTLHEAARGHGC